VLPKDENQGVVGEVVLEGEAVLKTDDVGCVDIDWFDNIVPFQSPVVIFTVTADLSTQLNSTHLRRHSETRRSPSYLKKSTALDASAAFDRSEYQMHTFTRRSPKH